MEVVNLTANTIGFAMGIALTIVVFISARVFTGDHERRQSVHRFRKRKA